MTPTTPVSDESTAASLPLLDARRWALGFLAFAVVLAVVFSQLLIDLIARAH
ncbi:hypothetical protein ACH4VS_33145 [Streptomyces hygroscopicus]|uniref:hypothetical protein n=1 Tax=Streptomyces hygroscopicus TaxID=1912 RepID=UPI000B33DFB0|nr:hypothetical protein [Streptomyces hygroscopicus]GLV78284.1 hypothetical protein Shyhy02_62840 [Streptomyces hygroscopicus subsp. hygroscopicus]